MPDLYITNQEETVAELMRRIPQSHKIDILVGYFYFSGISAMLQKDRLKENLLKAPMRILVGMEIDNTLRAEISRWEPEEGLTNLEKKEAYLKQLEGFLNSEAFDDKEALGLFFQKLEAGSLEIRRTADPVHAKVYLFQQNENPRDFGGKVMITGSSNLTAAGLENQVEFNILDTSDSGFEAGQKLFDTLWAASTSLLDAEAAAELRPLIGLLAQPTPYEVYLKVLHEYFAYADREQEVYLPSKAGFNDYRYQTDAVAQTVQMILSHGGALLADVVGLGKSIIAASAAKTLLDCGEADDVYIICPPALMDSWKDYCRQFRIRDHVFSSGNLRGLHKKLLSPGHEKRRYLILIDEAHRFRNPATDAYGLLAQICAGHRVLLLTATPINNTSSDIFSLVELFQDVNSASIFGFRSIVNEREEILKQEKELRRLEKSSNGEDRKRLRALSKRILELLAPVLVRRTRLDLENTAVYKEDLKKQRTEFNRVANPELYEYNLGNLTELYGETLDKINPHKDAEQPEHHFLGVRYQALNYLKKDPAIRKRVLGAIYPDYTPANDDFIALGARNLSRIMRHMLVRRFESSLEAFRKSVDRMLRGYQLIDGWLDKDFFPINKEGGISNIDEYLREADLFDDIEGVSYGDIIFDEDKAKDEESLHVIKQAKESFDGEFYELLRKDREILREIQKNWQPIKNDYKLDALKEKLYFWLKKNPGRKIVIFSEFGDTVDYLGRELKKEFRAVSYTSNDSGRKEAIISDFDASKAPQDQTDNYDILIATDALSEGVNLHRAGIIVNYDIPYNPTRVIQRVGRINRIGVKNFDRLYIYNFVPREEAQKDINNWQIANFKMDLINAVLGNDTRILKTDEDISAVFKINESKFFGEEEISWDTPFRNTYTQLEQDKELFDRIQALPPRLEIGRLSPKGDGHSSPPGGGLLEIRRIYSDLFASLFFGGSDFSGSIEDVFSCLRAEASEKALPTTDRLSALKKERRAYRPSRDKNYSHEALTELNAFIKQLSRPEEKAYAESLLKFGRKRRLSLNTLGKIRRLFTDNRGKAADIILKGLRRIAPDIYLKKLKLQEEAQAKLAHYAQLIVTEELIPPIFYLPILP